MRPANYVTDPEWLAGSDYKECVRWAIYSHKHFLNTRRHGFHMAAAEYKIDRASFLQRARQLRPKQ